ncbi:hypothetical protein BDA99DRAFT_252600 [Phascolomyces articulosus]|uniref:Uncharacterized protein n=1 Tax=Phascolomyces articulosus TaxID=60185 RepID=A0AAD5JZF3_9FUNG|nr:hypothetical protein BDA99DRAFT_252600 [Phascolomyces articulosus]
MIVCEYHYYAHLGLICRHCDEPILGPVNTDLRFHPHCLQCPDCIATGKEQGEPCFEQEGQAYCRYHFSMLPKTHCAGCDQAILKQFVEHHQFLGKRWHPECYMIQKFWNIRLSESYCYENPKLMDPKRLQQVQALVEQKVNRIWTDVSAFEESSATCISDMLLHVAAGASMEGLRMAAQFVTHLEVLFTALDWIHTILFDQGEVLQCTQESRTVCNQIIRFFHLLAYQQHDAMEHQKEICVTQELLPLVTGMAQNLKTLIRIGLTEALRLESQYHIQDSVYRFLSNLLLLEKKRVWMAGRYWFKEDPFFLPSSSSPLSDDILVDKCQRCFRSIDDECFKKGPLRWHTSCFICTRCHRPLSKELQRARLSHYPSAMIMAPIASIATVTVSENERENYDDDDNNNEVHQIDEDKQQQPQENNSSHNNTIAEPPQQQTMVLLCNICCTSGNDKRQHSSSTPTIVSGMTMMMENPPHQQQVFVHISRLEQYLDHVKAALTRLYTISTNNNMMMMIPSTSEKVKGSGEVSKKVMLHEYETRLNTDPTTTTTTNKSKRQSTLLRLMNRTNSTRRRQSLFGSVHLSSVKRAKSTKENHPHDEQQPSTTTTHYQFSPTVRRVTSIIRDPSASTSTPPPTGSSTLHHPVQQTTTTSRFGSLRRALSGNRRERRPLYGVFDRHTNNNNNNVNSSHNNVNNNSNNNINKRSNNSNNNIGACGVIIEHQPQTEQQQQQASSPSVVPAAAATTTTAAAAAGAARRASVCTLDTTSEGISTPVGPPSPDDSTSSENTCQLAQLSTVQDTIVRHMAVLYLESIVLNYLTLDQLIAMVEMKRSSFWYRLKARVGATGGGIPPLPSISTSTTTAMASSSPPPAVSIGGADGNISNNNNNNNARSNIHMNNKHYEAPSRSPLLFHHPQHNNNNASSSKKTFGISLSSLVAQDKSTGTVPHFPSPTCTTNSMLAPCFTPTASIPCIVQNCILALLGMDMSLEGVFRKNGNIRELNETCDAIDHDNKSIEYLNESPIQLAALLKRYLRELPEPLLTFKLYNLLITSTRMETEDKAKKILHMACCMLPKSNRDTMQLLFLFLKWVATFHETNKMDVGNLARVIAPTVFYSPTASKELAEERQRGAREEIRVVEMLIHYQDEFCKVPSNWIPFLYDPRVIGCFTTTNISSRQALRSLDQMIHPSAPTSSPPSPSPATINMNPLTPPTSPQSYDSSSRQQPRTHRRSWLLVGRQS